MLTTGFGIKDSGTVRRIEVGEIVEVLKGPFEEEAVKVQRVFVKAMKEDGAEGWVSLAGNQGTTFLVEGGNLFKVVADTILTETFLLDGSGPKATTRMNAGMTRKLKAGEILEVREWPRLEEVSGLTRMKCRCRNDGAVGWVTLVGNTGSVFVEAL